MASATSVGLTPNPGAVIAVAVSIRDRPDWDVHLMKLPDPLDSPKLGSGGGERATAGHRGSVVEPVAGQTAEARQFQRFLEVADQFGSNLTSLFNDYFPKVVAPSVASATSDTGVATPVPPGSVTPIENAKASNRHSRSSPAGSDNRPTEAAAAADEATNAALRLAEAMIIVLFLALGEKERNALKRGFDSLLQKLENLDLGQASPGALQAQREILRAVEKMVGGTLQYKSSSNSR